MKRHILRLVLSLAIINLQAKSPKITLSMIVKNEADRYLKQVLVSVRNIVDEAVIIDDASTDNTKEMCRKILNNIPLKLIENKESKFKNEVTLRKQQWEETIKTNPEWILNLDADEIFENKTKYQIKDFLKNCNANVVYFRLYDFWNDTHYREDKYWSAHLGYKPFLVRYRKDFNYLWQENAQHCGRFPYTVRNLPGVNSSLRIKHMGWARHKDRVAKYDRYMALDPYGSFGVPLEQYKSILDRNPRLIKWKE